MLKKIFLLLFSLGWIWAVQQRWGDLPLLSRFFHYSTSPLQLDSRFENSSSLRTTPFGAVEIGIDKLGVPHIFGKDELAVDFATGYVHARDRLFQMEMLIRVVKGRVSELAGEAALGSDLFWRKFEFERLVPTWYAALADSLPELSARMEAYAEGVNYYQRTMPFGAMPLEYHLLGVNPTPWKAENLFYLLRYMSHVLTYSEDDLKASETKSKIGKSLYDFWYPFYNRLPYPIYPDFEMSDSVFASLIPRVTEQLAEDGSHHYPQAMVKNNDELSLGSNNWAVQASKSATGNPFLCNDTHLNIALPSTWYEVQRVVNGRISRGFSIAGSPFVITGFSDSVAWGMTNATWDLVDFYQLETNETATAYRLDGVWETLEPFEVRIAVKGKADVLKTYYRSHFGPVDTLSGRYLAVNWIGMLPTNEAAAFDGLEKANNLQEAFAALQHFKQPPQNLILADSKGQIGLVTAGLACLHPLPEKGVRWGTHAAQLIGYVSMNNYLHVFNPGRAYVYSANQEHVDHPISAHISTRYEPTARGKRITELMEGFEKLGDEQLRALHMDILDVEYGLLHDRIMAVCGQAARYFENWNGSMDTAWVAPTLFYSFKNQLVRALAARLGDDLRLPPSEQHIFNTIALDDSIPVNGAVISSHELCLDAWERSLADLQQRFGADMDTWHYGKFHQTNIRHILRLDPLSIPLFASNGSNRTVNVASRLPVTHAASMRTIIEMRPEGPRALLMLTGGQSGRFNSKNYQDQVYDWLAGNYHEAVLNKQFDPQQFRSTIQFVR
jgi:penicillin G amidase